MRTERPCHPKGATMRHRRGFAIVTSLLIMLVIAGIGAGAVFLTLTNLRIAENARAAMVAQYNAEAGLDLALIAIAQAYRRDGNLPTLSQLRGLTPELGAFEITELTVAADEGIVRVRGYGLNGSAHATGARFRSVDAQIEIESTTDPLVAIGFVTNGNIYLPGNGTFDLSMWAGGTVTATGGQSALGVGRIGRAAGSICNVGRTNCLIDQDPPEVTTFSFAAAREALEAEAPACTRTLSSPPLTHTLSFATNEVICLEPAATLYLGGTVTNTYVIGGPSTTTHFTGDAVPATAGGVGVKIASGTVELRGGALRGENSVFAINSIVLDMNVVSHDRVVRTVIASESDVRLNGSGNRDAYATFRANGNFCFNGTLNRFVGTVVTSNRTDVPNPICGQTQGIVVSGSITEASLPDEIDNPNVPRTTIVRDPDASGIKVLARRP
jgi:hypothetical protein